MNKQGVAVLLATIMAVSMVAMGFVGSAAAQPATDNIDGERLTEADALIDEIQDDVGDTVNIDNDDIIAFEDEDGDVGSSGVDVLSDGSVEIDDPSGNDLEDGLAGVIISDDRVDDELGFESDTSGELLNELGDFAVFDEENSLAGYPSEDPTGDIEDPFGAVIIELDDDQNLEVFGDEFDGDERFIAVVRNEDGNFAAFVVDEDRSADVIGDSDAYNDDDLDEALETLGENLDTVDQTDLDTGEFNDRVVDVHFFAGIGLGDDELDGADDFAMENNGWGEDVQVGYVSVDDSGDSISEPTDGTLVSHELIEVDDEQFPTVTEAIEQGDGTVEIEDGHFTADSTDSSSGLEDAELAVGDESGETDGITGNLDGQDGTEAVEFDTGLQFTDSATVLGFELTVDQSYDIDGAAFEADTGDEVVDVTESDVTIENSVIAQESDGDETTLGLNDDSLTDVDIENNTLVGELDYIDEVNEGTGLDIDRDGDAGDELSDDNIVIENNVILGHQTQVTGEIDEGVAGDIFVDNEFTDTATASDGGALDSQSAVVVDDADDTDPSADDLEADEIFGSIDEADDATSDSDEIDVSAGVYNHDDAVTIEEDETDAVVGDPVDPTDGETPAVTLTDDYTLGALDGDFEFDGFDMAVDNTLTVNDGGVDYTIENVSQTQIESSAITVDDADEITIDSVDIVDVDDSISGDVIDIGAGASEEIHIESVDVTLDDDVNGEVDWVVDIGDTDADITVQEVTTDIDGDAEYSGIQIDDSSLSEDDVTVAQTDFQNITGTETGISVDVDDPESLTIDENTLNATDDADLTGIVVGDIDVGDDELTIDGNTIIGNENDVSQGTGLDIDFDNIQDEDLGDVGADDANEFHHLATHLDTSNFEDNDAQEQFLEQNEFEQLVVKFNDEVSDVSDVEDISDAGDAGDVFNDIELITEEDDVYGSFEEAVDNDVDDADDNNFLFVAHAVYEEDDDVTTEIVGDELRVVGETVDDDTPTIDADTDGSFLDIGESNSESANHEIESLTFEVGESSGSTALEISNDRAGLHIDDVTIEAEDVDGIDFTSQTDGALDVTIEDTTVEVTTDDDTAIDLEMDSASDDVTLEDIHLKGPGLDQHGAIGLDVENIDNEDAELVFEGENTFEEFAKQVDNIDDASGVDLLDDIAVEENIFLQAVAIEDDDYDLEDTDTVYGSIGLADDEVSDPDEFVSVGAGEYVENPTLSDADEVYGPQNETVGQDHDSIDRVERAVIVGEAKVDSTNVDDIEGFTFEIPAEADSSAEALTYDGGDARLANSTFANESVQDHDDTGVDVADLDGNIEIEWVQVGDDGAGFDTGIDVNHDDSDHNVDLTDSTVQYNEDGVVVSDTGSGDEVTLQANYIENNDNGVVAEDNAYEDDITIEANTIVDNVEYAIEADDDDELSAQFNYFGEEDGVIGPQAVSGNDIDPDYEAGTDNHDILYEPMLTAPHDEYDEDPEDIGETTDYTFDLTVDGDAGFAPIGFPGVTDQTVGEAVEDGFEGSVSAYNTDTGQWESVDPDDEINPLDAYIVSPAEGEELTVNVNMTVVDDDASVPSTTELSDGWNFVAAPSEDGSDEDNTFNIADGDGDQLFTYEEQPEVFVSDEDYDEIGSDGTVVNELDGSDEFVSPFVGTWVLVDEDDESSQLVGETDAQDVLDELEIEIEN